MTKSEFVDQVAARSGLSRKDAGAGRRRGARDHPGRARARQRGHLLRLRQVPRRRARRAPGRQPATGEKIQIAASTRAEVHRRRRAEEGRQGLSPVRRAPSRGPLRRPPRRARRRARVADRPRARPRPGPGVARGARRARRRDGDPAARAAEVVVAHCAALIDAAGPACVAVKPQVACFERLGAARLGRARARRRRRPRRRACSSSPTPSAATST